MTSDTDDGGRRFPLGEPQQVHPPAMDYCHDLGPLGDGPTRLFAPPAMLPIPVEMIADNEWAPTTTSPHGYSVPRETKRNTELG